MGNIALFSISLSMAAVMQQSPPGIVCCRFTTCIDLHIIAQVSGGDHTALASIILK